MSKKHKKHMSVQARNRLFFLRPICIFLVFFLIITIVSNTITLYKLNDEKLEKEKTYTKSQEKSEYLKNEIIKLNNPEYLAMYAREQYSYSKDGELILKINKNEEEKLESSVENKNEKGNYNKYIVLGISIFILWSFISLIRRKDDKSNNEKSV